MGLIAIELISGNSRSNDEKLENLHLEFVSY